MRKTRRFLAFILAMIMTLQPVVTALAETGTEGMKTNGTENTELNTVPVSTPSVKQTPSEAKEQVRNEVPFEQSRETCGIIVTVRAEAGVFPAGAELSVKKVTKAAVLRDVEDAVEEAREEETNVSGSYTFDIKVLYDGKEIEPEGDVQVSFALAEVIGKNEQVNVYHVSEEKEELTAEFLETEERVEENQENARRDEETVVTVETCGFSYYVVEFTYGGLEYVLEGDTSVKVSEIQETLDLEGIVTGAESSNKDLFTVEKDSEGDDWTVTAKQAFASEESLTLTIGGKTYVIRVTDTETYDIYWICANGVLTMSGEKITGGSGFNNDTVFDAGNPAPWAAQNISTVNIKDGKISPESTAYWFDGLGNCLFNLKSLDTSSVTSMSHMFSGCNISGTLDISGFTADNVRDMSSMFEDTTGAIDFGEINTENVKNMSAMFKNYKVRENEAASLDLSMISTAQVENMASMFMNAQLGSVNIRNFNTSNVTDMSHMFENCTELTEFTCDYNFTTAKVADMNSMFKNCGSLEKIDDLKFYIDRATDTSYMFYGCKALTAAIALNDSGAGKFITDAAGMFDSCGGNVKVTIKNIDFVKLESAYRMFAGLSGSVTISNVSMKQVTDMSEMFKDSKVSTIDLSTLSVSAVENMQHMFSSSTAQTIDVSALKTGRVTDMSYMFYNCGKLTSLRINGLQTGAVTTMESMFGKCEKLPSLDIRSFNTGKVTTMNKMFYKCSVLVTIKASETFVTNAETNDTQMFQFCNLLVGQNGTAYNEDKKDKTYACIDTPRKKGYFSSGYANIVYYLNGGTNNKKNPVKYDWEQKTALYDPARTGYLFKGWYTDKACTKQITEIPAGKRTTLTLYAKWSINAYVVKFNGNGQTSGSMVSQSRIYGDKKALTANAFRKTGYTFTGWNTKADGKGTAFKNKTTVNIRTTAGTTTLYAQWSKDKYTITYNLNGGKNSSSNPASYSVTTSAITLKAPARTGYTFGGWYSDARYKTKVSSIKKGSTGNRTFYAKWTANAYTVKFNGNGAASGVMAGVSRKYDDKKALPANAYKKTGYTFTGWNTKADGKGTAFADRTTANIRSAAGTTTLYAQWKKTKYTITYKLDGGTNNSRNPESYYYTSADITLQKPTRKGCTFAGWYSDSKFKTKVTTIKKGSTGNKTLYAKWTNVNYTITYKLNGGTNNKSNPAFYSTAASTITLKNPTKKGYTFKGWYSDSSFKTRVKTIVKGSTGNRTLYAKWEITKYTITYVLNGGTNNKYNYNTYYIDTETFALKKPTRSGYIFKGWYSDSSFKTAVTKITKGSTGNITLYAKWASGAGPAIRIDGLSLQDGVYVLPNTGKYWLQMENIDTAKEMEVHSSDQTVARAVLNEGRRRYYGQYDKIVLNAYKSGTVRIWLTEPGKTAVIAEVYIRVPAPAKVMMYGNLFDEETGLIKAGDMFFIENISLEDLKYSFTSETAVVKAEKVYHEWGSTQIKIVKVSGSGPITLKVSSRSNPALKCTVSLRADTNPELLIKKEGVSKKNGKYVLPSTGMYEILMVDIDTTKKMEVHTSDPSVARPSLNDYETGVYENLLLFCYRKGTVRIWLTEPGKTKVIEEITVVIPERTELLVSGWSADPEGKTLAVGDTICFYNIAWGDYELKFTSKTVTVEVSEPGYNGDGCILMFIRKITGTGTVTMTVTSKSQPALKYTKTFKVVSP